MAASSNMGAWRDIALGNLLIQAGRLSAVIDFGQLAVGDPACDLAIAWSYFAGESRVVFQQELGLDPATWQRARAWALWKALITAAGLVQNNTWESQHCWDTLAVILAEDEG